MPSKLNGWTKTLVTIAGIVFAAGVLYACVANNTKRIDVNVKSIEKVDDKTDRDRNYIIGLQKDVFYIKEKVDRNAIVQQEILREIKELKK